MKHAKYIYFVLVFCFYMQNTAAQNIVGYKILVAADAPAFIAFPSEVDNARWDNNEMNEYFKFSTRNENTMQISYNGKKDPPLNGTGFSVIQGKNTHIFTLVFKKDYDINKDPVLYYDFSDKTKLKQAIELAQQQSGQQGTPGDQTALTSAQTTTTDKEAAKEEKARLAKQQQEEEQHRKELALQQQQKKKELDAQQKAEAAKAAQTEKAKEAEIARAKAEAQRIEQEQQKAKEQEAALAKANAAAEKKKQAEALQQKKEKEAEDKRLAQEAERQKQLDKQEADKVKVARETAAREEAERKRIAAREEKERLAKEKQEQEETERQRKAALARQEAEDRQKAREEAEARLAALQQEKEDARRNARYTMAGLWNRYGKNGINLYEIPPEQNSYNNTDFYVAKDTLTNFENSNTFLAESPRLDIKAESSKGVTATLQSISFKGPIAYYRIQIQNNNTEDYLVGVNNLAWYNPDGSARRFLKCSYLTHIGFFPLVKPGETRDYIYATRAANITEDDHLVLTISERRPDEPSFKILFDGAVYLKELNRVAIPLEVSGNRKHNTPDNTDKKEKKKKKKKEKKEQETAE